MKVKSDFKLHSVGDENIIIPIGDTKFNGMIRLNNTATFLWEQLETDKTIDELVEITAKEYDVSQDEVRDYISEFIQKMKDVNLIDE